MCHLILAPPLKLHSTHSNQHFGNYTNPTKKSNNQFRRINKTTGHIKKKLLKLHRINFHPVHILRELKQSHHRNFDKYKYYNQITKKLSPTKKYRL